MFPASQGRFRALRRVRSLLVLGLSWASAACQPTGGTDATGEGQGPGTAESEVTSDASTTTSGSSSTSPTTGATTESSGDSSSFIEESTGPSCAGPAPDGSMGRCSPASCSLWEQSCPAGQKCTPDQEWSWHACVPLDPEPDAPGQPCTVEDAPGDGGDSCDLASMCWDVDPQTHVGECFLRCTGSPEEPVCPDGTTCVIGNEGALILCLPTCHPLAQDCPEGEACLWGGEDSEPFACIAEYSGDEGQVFDSCDYANRCDPGLTCWGPEGAVECDPNADGCCLPYCDTEQPDACPGAMQVCLPWFEAGTAPPGYEHVGVCTLPL